VFRKSLKAAVCVLAAGTALTACGPLKPGAAAIVGDHRITVSELDSAVTRWSKEIPSHPETQQIVAKAQQASPPQQVPFDPSSPQRSALYQLINIRVLDEVARDQHVAVTPGQVDAFVAATGGRPNLDASVLAEGLPTSYGNDFARSVLVRQALAERQAGGGPHIDIKINPRFGTLDGANGFGTVCPRLSTADPATPDGPSSVIKCG
jgi:hypothetical protein